MELEINHLATEALIKKSGILYTILRNGWYMELHLSLLVMSRELKHIYYVFGNEVVAGTLKTEYAKTGAKVILEGVPHSIIELTSCLFTYGE
ncbi:Rossmann-fold NAD(P)-binding domain-containing protein [Riemerella columbipharyngis]|uniref:hypothetical protein n=1 Tax=Riemerella columbipharyngis TaxID=1071918 RepID=UPI000B8147A8|nr:hypothetical protein [Riemerella columbipharyngis]